MGESVEAGPFVHDNPLDIEQIRPKAQNQWLPRREICQILQNHKGFHITSARHDKPPSGSLFLFNKEEQRYFRNDGHNWTKKKDGKTISEGHRPFKVEGFGNLNCYYAHGEENRNFLRRCYWMREGDFSHIVLVHYLEETIDAGGSDPKVPLFYSNSIDESLSTIPDMGNSDTDADLAQLMDELFRTPLDLTILEDKWESFTSCGQSIEHGSSFSSSRPEANLLLRFYKILCSGSSASNPVTSSLEDAFQLSSKISSLLKGDNKELDQMLKSKFSLEKIKDQLLQKHLKEKLRVWILQKLAKGSKVPSVLDEGGQGVLHLAAALGYDWALEPTILAGVSVDFRNVNGWTALQWAAFCGREQAVASLISLGAAPGALTERSPEYPSGRTPTDLASVNGHKRIAGYLADRPLDVHIPSINFDHQDGAVGPKAVRKFSEISAAPLSLGNASDGQSQKDLSATSLGSPWEPVGSLGEPRSGLSLPSSPPPSQPLAKCPLRRVRPRNCRIWSGW